MLLNVQYVTCNAIRNEIWRKIQREKESIYVGKIKVLMNMPCDMVNIRDACTIKSTNSMYCGTHQPEIFAYLIPN